jgi:hypothetical protein
MWIDPKTNWTRDSVPLPGDFNRIEGNVKELKAGVDGLAADALTIPRITVLLEQITNLDDTVDRITIGLPNHSGHRFYLVSIYALDSSAYEEHLVPGTKEMGTVVWWLTRGKGGIGDFLTIQNSAYLGGKTYIKVAYIE